MKRKKGKGQPDADRSEESPWKARLQRMKSFQEKNSKNWKRNERLLYGQVEEGDSENVYSFGWGLVKALETSIYVQNPEMMVEPYDGSKLELAHLLTAISNYDLDQMDIKSIGNLGLLDCFTAGYFACIEVVETDKTTVESKDGDEEAKEEVRVDEQGYVARRIPPKDLLVDPQATRLDLADARYIAIATYPTVAELEASEDPEFDLPDDLENYPEASETTRGTGPDSAKSGESRVVSQKETDPNYKRICVWECYDNIAGKITYVTDHKKKEIGEVEQKVKLKLGKRKLYPVTVMAFHPATKGWYPKPEFDLICSQLETLNKLDSSIYKAALTKWNKWAAIAGYLSGDAISKLTDPTVDHAVIEIDEDPLKEFAAGQQVHQFPNLKELLAQLPNPQPNPDQLAIRDMCKQEIMDIVGYGPGDRAGLPKTRSAREAIAIKERQDARLAKRSDAIGDFYRMFGSKHLMILRQTMAKNRYVRIFPAAAHLATYMEYSEKELGEGDFNFIVFAGTSGPRNLESRKASEIQLFQTLLPLAQAGKIPVEPLVLRLAEVFQWRGVDALLRNYKPATVQLAKVLFAMNSQKGVPPNALLESAAAVVQSVLTPEELQAVQKEIAGQGQPPQGQQAPKGVRGDPGQQAAEAGMIA